MKIHFYYEWDKHQQTRKRKRTILLAAICLLSVMLCIIIFSSEEQGQAAYLYEQDMAEQGGNQLLNMNGMLYTVKQGDTLWNIAENFYPDLGQTKAVKQIQQQNGMSGTAIHVGQTILLP